MCLHPKKNFDTGYKTDNGKPLYKMCSYDTQFIYKPISKDDIYSKNVYTDIIIRDYIEIPCGNCAECRLNNSIEWAGRCVKESKQYKHNEMLTLTYNDKNLPLVDSIDLNTGEVIKRGTLVKKHVQEFMKNLRRYWEYHFGAQNIKFKCAGEYGEKRKRPHYHLIMFNFEVPDKEKFVDENGKVRLSKYGIEQKTSKIIQKIWGKGDITLDDVNFETCAYVARYIMKKQKGKNAKEFYKTLNIEPEFTLESKGIGKDYFEEIKDDYEHAKMFVNTKKGQKRVKLSRYYDKLYEKTNEEEFTKIKAKRRENQEEVEKMILSKTSLNKIEYLETREENLKARLKQYSRNYERDF